MDEKTFLFHGILYYMKRLKIHPLSGIISTYNHMLRLVYETFINSELLLVWIAFSQKSIADHADSERRLL